MKNTLLSFLIYLVVSFTSANALFADKLPSPFIILPQPQRVIMLNGPALEPSILQHLSLRGEFNRPVMGDLLSQLTIGESLKKEHSLLYWIKH